MDTQKKVVHFEKKSKFDENRLTYIADDCSLVYLEEIKVGKQWIRKVRDVIPFTPETAQLIIDYDEEMHQEDLQKRYDAEHLDYGFLNQTVKQSGDGYYEEDDDEGHDTLPIENIADPAGDLFDQVFPEDEPENPLIARVRDAVDHCTEKQQDIFYTHLGMGVTMEQMRADEESATGKSVKQQAVFDRKKKLVQNVAKSLGVEPPKKIKK